MGEQSAYPGPIENAPLFKGELILFEGECGCSSEYYNQLSFKYFVLMIINFQVIVKSVRDPDDNLLNITLSINRLE